MANPTETAMEAAVNLNEMCAYVLVAIHVSETKETNPNLLKGTEVMLRHAFYGVFL